LLLRNRDAQRILFAIGDPPEKVSLNANWAKEVLTGTDEEHIVLVNCLQWLSVGE
jgi:hypothetical protein